MRHSRKRRGAPAAAPVLDGCPTAAAGSLGASVLLAAGGPGLRPALRVQLRCAGVLLGLGGRGGIAGAADRLPGLLVELVLAAVGPAPADGGGIAAGLARRDRAERAARGTGRAGRARGRRGGRRTGARARRGGRRSRGRSGQLGLHALQHAERLPDVGRPGGTGIAVLADAVVQEVTARLAAELLDLVVVHLVRALDPVGDGVLGLERRGGGRNGRGAEDGGRRGGARQGVSERDDVSHLLRVASQTGPSGPGSSHHEGRDDEPVAGRTRTATGRPAVRRTYPGPGRST